MYIYMCLWQILSEYIVVYHISKYNQNILQNISNFYVHT